MTAYRHTQRAPLCFLVYALAMILFVMGTAWRSETPILWTFSITGFLTLVLAASFHYLTVEDQGERLSICFGPVPLFRRSMKYEDIMSAEVGRTTILDGWGIHMSLQGGWVWNLWGRDCVVIRFKNGGRLRVGTDDADNLASYIQRRLLG